MLSVRKRKILCLLVARYIETAEPVSSSDIKADYGEEISSATIRSELAKLEEMGYLMQPHVSAGRVPTAKGYKVFVESIPTEGGMLPAVADMREYLDRKMDEVGDVIRTTAKLLSDTTNYTSVIVVKNIGEVLVRDVRLVDIGQNKALVIIITDSGILKDCIIDLPADMGNTYLNTAMELLNRMFSMHTVEEIKELVDHVEDEIAQYKMILDQIITSLERYQNRNQEVIIEGTSRLLDVPEYQEEADRMRGVMSIIDHKELLTDMVGDGELELSFKIGKDDGIENGSLVTATYRINDNQQVHAGVIGPERMDYRKVVTILKNLETTIKSVMDDKED
ncbi:MAG: heat-inducible transcription repressor HrcA [Clostridia bacterium]|nr:heat-inducible transcription repressor HrcA [Clostridia bacterium]